MGWPQGTVRAAAGLAAPVAQVPAGVSVIAVRSLTKNTHYSGNIRRINYAC